MRNRIQHLHQDERGMSFVFVGVGFMAFFAATTLAIDVGLLMTARSQAQNAADAGALAGAVALTFNSYTDRSANGPVVQSAINAALANTVAGAPVSVDAGDVTFPTDPFGEANRVEVQVFRTSGRSNPVPMMISSIFGVPSVSIGATAIAEASSANAQTCIKPWTVPNKWTENQTPPWDTGDTFSAYPKSPTLSPDVYVPVGQSGQTGYSSTTDLGLQIVLKAGSGNNISPSIYNPIDLPGSSGGDDYRWNIANCNPGKMQIGDLMLAEPGNMVGPTKQGTDDLVARDPNAYWDDSAKRVVSTMSPSPRVVVIPLYDPYYFDTGKKTGSNTDFKIADFMGFFVEGVQGNGDVTGRIVPVTGLVQGTAPTGTFARAIRLVQ